MAKALVEVIGDSASAVRALEATSAALTSTGEAAAGAATEVDAFAASLAKAQATRAETLLAQSASLRQLSTSSVAGSTEQMAANEAALKRQTQAYKLLGIQAATTKTSVAETAGTIGRGLTTYVTAPAAFVGYEAVKQAIDFNQQMLLLKTQAGDATDSIQRLSAEVLKLASSGAPQGPVQLSEGLFHLVSLGLRGAQAMGTLREASLAAGMGMANLEDTSTALGAAVVSGIKGARDYSQAMATLVGTAGAGNMRFQDLAASIGNVIPSAAAAGITLHEMGAALAVLTDRGMTAEEAATRLRMSLSLIQRPSKAATVALADMGVNANDLGAMIRQPNGLLKVLEVLHTAIDKVGTVRGNRDLLAAFGGARSGIGIQTLVQSLDSSVSSYQGKLQQIQQDQQQFAANQQTYLESPAYRLHTALAQVEADLVKLGQSLTPAVTGLAGTISTIANGFESLPGPIKEAVGVIVGVLAVGGPIGLAMKGLIGLWGGLARAGVAALRTLGLAASADAVEMNALAASETRVGTAAVAAGTEGRAAFAGIGSAASEALAPVLILAGAIKGLIGDSQSIHKLGTVGYGRQVFGHTAGDATIYEQNGKFYEQLPPGMRGRGGPGVREISQAEADRLLGLPTPAERRRESRGQGGEGHTSYAREYARRHRHDHVPGASDAYTSAPTVAGTTAAAAAAAAKKRQTEFDQAVHNDQLLARARIDLANGETAAAEHLLSEDRQRLRAMLAEAKTATERTAVLRQLAEVDRLQQSTFDQAVRNDTLLTRARNDRALGETSAAQRLLALDEARLRSMLAEAQTQEERNAILRQLTEVNRLRHTKTDAFALSPELQMEIARADAEAAMRPSSFGPDSEQIRLARQAKAAALKAIHSHTLTMQGLIQAWQIVGQENSILAQAKGAADTYHAVSSKAIVDSVKGLTQTQQMQLRERIAQEEAHRGYAPNQVGSKHHHYHHVHVHVHSNDSHIVKVVDRHRRNSHQRAGSRR